MSKKWFYHCPECKQMVEDNGDRLLVNVGNVVVQCWHYHCLVKFNSDYKCTMGECPFCLALNTTNHSSKCPIFIGFKNDGDLQEIIDCWDKNENRSINREEVF